MFQAGVLLTCLPCGVLANPGLVRCLLGQGTQGLVLRVCWAFKGWEPASVSLLPSRCPQRQEELLPRLR